MILTDSIYKKLKPYERFMRQAFYGNYISGFSTLMARAVSEIYREAGGNKAITPTCGYCNKAMLHDLGREFFAYTPAPEETPVEAPADPVEEVSDTPVDNVPEKVAEEPGKAVKESKPKAAKKPAKKSTSKARKGGK